MEGRKHLRKHLPVLLLILGLLGLILGAGCGGGGGGGNGGDGGNGGFTNIHVEGVSGGNQIDLMNLKPGQSVQLRLVGTDSQNQEKVLAATNWTTNAPANVATVSAAGVLKAVNANNNVYRVSATFRSQTYNQQFSVRGDLATVKGQVRTLAGAPVGNGIIAFYNLTGHRIASVRVGSDGQYSVNVPIGAKTFVLDTANMPGYYAQFTYKGGEYTLEIPECRVTLPPLTKGGTVTLSDIIVRVKGAGSPPPPPPGCFSD
jgi:hypothetical protein